MDARRCFYLMTALACILSLAAVGYAGAASSKEVIVLKFADPSPHGTTRTLSVVKWGEELEKRSDGRLKFEWYWSQSLAKATDTLNAIAGGIADAGMNAVMGYQISQLPIWQLPELPMLCGSDMRAHGKVRKEMYFTIPEMKKEYDSTGVKLMVLGAYEPTIFFSKKPLRKLEDFKGVRIGNKGELAKFVAAAGGAAAVCDVAGDPFDLSHPRRRPRRAGARPAAPARSRPRRPRPFPLTLLSPVPP